MTASAIRKALALLMIAAAVASCRDTRERPMQERYAAAVPSECRSDCLPPDERERRRFDLAATVIETAAMERLSSLDIGAMKFIGQHVYRDVGDGRPVCKPVDVMDRVSKALISRNGFGPGRLTEYELSLAAQLPARNSAIVDEVARSAFNEHIQHSDTFAHMDIRPYARTVLASFGREAEPYGAIAYAQLGIATPMGTGAAQVAAAAGHPGALPRIKQLMVEALSATPRDRAIPRDTKNRLIELAWAVYFSGERSSEYKEPIHEIMSRKVQSWAPPFGMVDADPKRFCYVLERLEGEMSTAKYQYCRDPKIPLDQ